MKTSDVPRLTTTSCAILGQLALRRWPAYELIQEMRHNLHYFWPRAESGIYARCRSSTAGSRRNCSPQRTPTDQAHGRRLHGYLWWPEPCDPMWRHSPQRAGRQGHHDSFWPARRRSGTPWWRCWRRRGSHGWAGDGWDRSQQRSWCQAPCGTWWLARESSFETGASAPLRGCPGSGGYWP